MKLERFEMASDLRYNNIRMCFWYERLLQKDMPNEGYTTTTGFYIEFPSSAVVFELGAELDGVGSFLSGMGAVHHLSEK